MKKRLIGRAAFFLLSFFLVYNWVADRGNSQQAVLGQTWKLIKKEYVKEIPDSTRLIVKEIKQEVAASRLPDSVFFCQMERLVKSLGDKHSSFVRPDEVSEFLARDKEEYVGIGIVLGKEEEKIILNPYPESPAAKAGIKKGAQLLKVNGKDIRSLEIDEVIGLIKGPKNTFVELTVLQGNQTEEFKLERQLIIIPRVAYRMEDGIAIVSIYQFKGSAESQFAEVIKKVMDENPQGLVLDLRNNPGGDLTCVQNIAGYWFRGAVAYSIKNRAEEVVYTHRVRVPLSDLPTVVLINKNSASGSEMLAAALKDQERAILVGQTTYGKGVGQLRFTVGAKDYKSILRLTILSWRTPKGYSIDGEGVKPDSLVELTDKDMEIGHDTQLEKALEIVKTLNR